MRVEEMGVSALKSELERIEAEIETLPSELRSRALEVRAELAGALASRGDPPQGIAAIKAASGHGVPLGTYGSATDRALSDAEVQAMVADAEALYPDTPMRAAVAEMRSAEAHEERTKDMPRGFSGVDYGKLTVEDARRLHGISVPAQKKEVPL